MSIKDRNDWFDVWFADKECILNTMIKNMRSDLDAGYNYFGRSITMQRKEIEAYKDQFDAQVDAFKRMTETEVNRWCYYDMKKRGAID